MLNQNTDSKCTNAYTEKSKINDPVAYAHAYKFLSKSTYKCTQVFLLWH